MPCDIGTYMPFTGAKSSTECRSCEAGYACPTTGTRIMSVSCDPGYYCPPGTVYSNQYACPLGTYSDATNLTSSSECSDCPAGRLCTSTATTSSTISSCPAGYYCPARRSSGTPCAAGTWSNKTNLQSQDDCTEAPGGYYAVGGESSVSGDCEKGYYCPPGSSSATEYPCPAGYYSNTTNLYSRDHCLVTPPGYYSDSASEVPTLCPAGRFAARNGTASSGPTYCDSHPSVCTEQASGCVETFGGYYSEEGAIEPTECGVGMYSYEGQASCIECLVGHYCGSNTTNMSAMLNNGGYWTNSDDLAGRCFNGTFCPTGMTRAPDLTRDACPSGSYCPIAIASPLNCPAGTYNPFTGFGRVEDCLETPAGYYTIAGSSNITGLCSPGYYCPAGSTTSMARSCPATTYNPYYGRMEVSECALCVSGGYCPEASSQPSVCPRGYYCITGVSTYAPCPAGTFGNESGIRREEDCTSCLPGMYCDGSGLPRPRGSCDPGYYCIEGSNTSAPNAPGAYRVPESVGGVCPAGGYCPLGSSYPSACPSGTFGNTTGLTSLEGCTNCIPGYYCSGSNLPYPSGLCESGYYCESGSSSPTENECPKGSYSDTGASECSECEPGTWQPYRAQSSCVSCPAGYFCDGFALTSYEGCPQGYYCPEGISDYTKYPCPYGTYGAQTLLQAASECTPCSAGQYCNGEGLSEPTGDCSAGYYCAEGAFDNEGEYCFDIDIYTAEYDPASISNVTEINATLISFLVDCEKDGGICPAGSRCYAGSAYPQPCELGTYYADTGNTGDCDICDPGFACTTTGLTASTTPCDAGYFCRNILNGAESQTPICSEAACEDDYGLCPIGHHCKNQTIEPQPCSPGTYSPVEGLAVCFTCPAGSYCNGTHPDTYFECPQGFYCPTGTGLEIPACPPGTYGHTTGLRSASDCASCPAGRNCYTHGLMAPVGVCAAGFYCPLGSIYANGTGSDGETSECPAGAYCPEGSKVPILCPIGTYSEFSGQSDLSTCQNCTAGRFCASEGLSEPTADIDAGYYGGSGVSTSRPTETRCPQGFYCPRGSRLPIRCPAGTYAETPGLERCRECPSGYACAQGTIDPVLCEAGYWCPSGSSSTTENACPQGYWSNKTAAQALGDCKPVPPGYYAVGPGASDLDGLCSAGYYCSGLSVSATPTYGSGYGGKCGAGSACYAGSTEDVLCPGGYYCDGTQIVGVCNAGYYCVRNATTATPSGSGVDYGICPEGHYCPLNSILPTSCPPGTFLNSTQNTQLSDCRACLGGYTCPNASTIEPTNLCLEGYYCPTGSIVGEPCPPGSYCERGVAVNTSCPAGSYQPLSLQSICLQTPLGYYSISGSITYEECPKGYVCPRGTSHPYEFPCPNGTFSNWTGLYDVSQCTPCLPGYYCNSTGLSEPTAQCDAGYFCQEGSIMAQPEYYW
uniref:Chitin-binding type-2 domain-containing protein n=1 Tax=Aureoumbra lagunensis TaxID=44058 RepID=A0A7S3JP84_9STRA